MISIIDDAYEYVNAQKENEWDIIFMDINFKAEDPNISPPWKFLSKEFLQKLVDISDPKCSYIALNVLCYDKESKVKLIENLKQV